MDAKQLDAIKRKARKFWDSLSEADRFQLGDDLVLGDFDWRDWFEAKPPRGFMREVDDLRILDGG